MERRILQTAVTVSTIAGDVVTFFTSAISMATKVTETIVSNPLLMVLCVAVPLSGIAIGYVKRLIRLN